MRSHFLGELEIVGREIALAVEPGLDFYRADRVLALNIAFEHEVRVQLDLLYAGASQQYRLRLSFEGVRQLVLPEMTPLLWIPELEIEDVRASQLEGIRFEARSHLNEFRCACASIAVLELEPACS